MEPSPEIMDDQGHPTEGCGEVVQELRSAQEMKFYWVSNKTACDLEGDNLWSVVFSLVLSVLEVNCECWPFLSVVIEVLWV